MRNKGKFIAFCGLDGSGKTTIINALASYLNTNVIIIKHPPKQLKNYLTQKSLNGFKVSLKEEIEFIKSAKIKEQNEIIIPELEKGNTIMADRYIFCSYSHFIKEGMDFDSLINLTSDILMPHLTIYLKVSPELSLKRQLKKPKHNSFFAKNDLNRIQKSSLCYEQLSKLFNFLTVKADFVPFEYTYNECYTNILNIKTPDKHETIGNFLEERVLLDSNKNHKSLSLTRRIYKKINDIYLQKNIKELNKIY